MNDQLENLVIRGGGLKGFAILGCLNKLYIDDPVAMKNVKRYAGSSVGSIICLLLAVGYTPNEIYNYLMDSDLKSVFKINWFFAILNLFKAYGLNNGNKLKTMIGELLVDRGFARDITFSQLYEQTGKFLVITGTSLTARDTLYFNPDTTPDMPVLTAVRISSSIPLFFNVVKYKIANTTHTFVDGGLLVNFPLYYFDVCDYLGHAPLTYRELCSTYIKEPVENDRSLQCYQYKTLGITLLDMYFKKNNINFFTGKDTINNFLQFMNSLMNTLLTQIEQHTLISPVANGLPDTWSRSITIPLTFNIDLVQKDYNLEQFAKLYTVGGEAASDFLKDL